MDPIMTPSVVYPSLRGCQCDASRTLLLLSLLIGWNMQDKDSFSKEPTIIKGVGALARLTPDTLGIPYDCGVRVTAVSLSLPLSISLLRLPLWIQGPTDILLVWPQPNLSVSQTLSLSQCGIMLRLSHPRKAAKGKWLSLLSSVSLSSMWTQDIPSLSLSLPCIHYVKVASFV